MLAQMMDVHKATGRSVLAVNLMPLEGISSYGVVAAQDLGDGRSATITDMVERPLRGKAPATLAVGGRNILNPDILARQEPGSGGEIQLTDAIRKLIPGAAIEACRYRGRCYDCGSRTGYLDVTMEMRLAHPKFGPALKARLQGTLGQ